MRPTMLKKTWTVISIDHNTERVAFDFVGGKNPDAAALAAVMKRGFTPVAVFEGETAPVKMFSMGGL